VVAHTMLAPTASTAWAFVLAAAPDGAAAQGADSLPILLLLISIALHALVSVGVGYLLHRVRSRDKAIDNRFGRHDARLDRIEVGLSDATRSALIHDKKLELLMAREFVPRDECAAFRSEIRDTTTRLFSKVEVVQREGAATKAVCDLILNRLNREPRDGQA